MTKMKRTLYISDLDGTLLNSKGKISPYSLDAINRFSESGVLFTCATGRTLSSVKMLLGEARFTCPAVLSDGLLTFDMMKNEVVNVVSLSRDLIIHVSAILENTDQDGFLYCIKGNEYALFYTAARNALSRRFIESKRPFLKDNIFRIDHFSCLPEGYLPLYYVLYDEDARLKQLQQTISTLQGAHCLLNRDVYHDREDIYFMNILSDTTSKHSAINTLRACLDVDEVVAFGDNYNDLPMLKHADRSYVPENGIREAKQIATQVIPSCDLDSVVRFIEADSGR